LERVVNDSLEGRDLHILMMIHLVEYVESDNPLRLRQHACLDQVAQRRASFEPVRLTEMLVELLDALIESHFQNRLLVEDVEQVVQLLR